MVQIQRSYGTQEKNIACEHFLKTTHLINQALPMCGRRNLLSLQHKPRTSGFALQETEQNEQHGDRQSTTLQMYPDRKKQQHRVGIPKTCLPCKLHMRALPLGQPIQSKLEMKKKENRKQDGKWWGVLRYAPARWTSKNYSGLLNQSPTRTAPAAAHPSES